MTSPPYPLLMIVRWSWFQFHRETSNQINDRLWKIRVPRDTFTRLISFRSFPFSSSCRGRFLRPCPRASRVFFFFFHQWGPAELKRLNVRRGVEGWWNWCTPGVDLRPRLSVTTFSESCITFIRQTATSVTFTSTWERRRNWRYFY